MKHLIVGSTEMNFYSWIVEKRFKLVLIIIAILILSLISRLPYLNLILTNDVNLMVLLVIIIIIFDLKPHTLIKIAISLLLPTFIFLLLERLSVYEFIGNCIYILFASAIIKSVIGNEISQN